MDTFRTIAAPSPEILLKEKHSKFFGYAYPVSNDADVKPIIDRLRKQHAGAVHFCYAWQIGTDKTSYRTSDDGEPAGTAGQPIYGQIQSHGLTHVLVVVVRFFGGIKLGTGGLISAYRTAAQMALEASEIVERTVDLRYDISFEYADIQKVMRVVREKNLRVLDQRLDLSCTMQVSVPKANAAAMLAAFEPLYTVSVAET